MTIHWSLSVLGGVLLLFPADRLLSSSVELRDFSGFHSLENSPRFRPWWWEPVLWLDPLRAYLGAHLLQNGLTLKSVGWADISKVGYGVLVAILAISAVVQTFTRRGDQEILLAPVGFVAGIAGALLPWPVALIGTVVAVVGLFAFRQFRAYFACGLAAIALLGFALGAGVLWTVPAACLFALPVMTEFLSGRTLELPTRNSKGPRP